MNLEILKEHIDLFSREVITSGFKRDLDDYITSLPAAQSNIVALRDISEKVLSALIVLYSGDLQNGLKSLLPKGKLHPFTQTPHNKELKVLIENTEIQQPEFFNQLTQILSKLQKQVQHNMAEIEKIEQFITPYLSGEVERLAEGQFAIIAIVFNEQNTITSLKQFTRALAAWNRALPIYHQLVKSESPQDIQIIEVQNGSIDFVVNLNVDVALNLAELFKVGFQVFAAYLSYKKMIKPIIDSYHGNKELISQEEDREKLLLENIGKAIKKQIKAQHTKAKRADKAVDGTAIPKKVDQVTDLITSHIVKGNDLKLLAMPEAEEMVEDKELISEEKEALREQSMIARQQLREMPTEDRQMLLDVYGKTEEEVEEEK